MKKKKKKKNIRKLKKKLPIKEIVERIIITSLIMIIVTYKTSINKIQLMDKQKVSRDYSLI